jgi:alkanesulfonate monooxygenase SsuD/methylene tetrahydromethanopterin reductase-like flavin-dependent oxidoreductase (luciferase family)
VGRRGLGVGCAVGAGLLRGMRRSHAARFRVIQVGTRTPVAVAQAAITLSNLSGGRFLLGLGASGPQVIEGLHGVSFARPLSRLRETVDIVRQVIGGAKISYRGREFRIPWAGGDTVPMKLSMRAEYQIPIYLATLSPAMLRLTGEIADGWLGTSFVPEGADAAYFTHLDEGLARSGRSRDDLDICQGAEVAFAPDEDALRVMVGSRKKELAFSLGAWDRPRPISTTRPIAVRAGLMSPPRFVSAGRPVIETVQPTW